MTTLNNKFSERLYTHISYIHYKTLQVKDLILHGIHQHTKHYQSLWIHMYTKGATWIPQKYSLQGIQATLKSATGVAGDSVTTLPAPLRQVQAQRLKESAQRLKHIPNTPWDCHTCRSIDPKNHPWPDRQSYGSPISRVSEMESHIRTMISVWDSSGGHRRSLRTIRW